jgi:hypothetical protein
MSAANPVPDSALQPAPEADDDETSRPTQPWHAPPALLDALSAIETDFETDFDFHDTIPAPPWLDEPQDALDALPLPAR